MFPSEDKNGRESRFTNDAPLRPASRINLSPNNCSPLRKTQGNGIADLSSPQRTNASPLRIQTSPPIRTSGIKYYVPTNKEDSFRQERFTL